MILFSLLLLPLLPLLRFRVLLFRFFFPSPFPSSSLQSDRVMPLKYKEMSFTHQNNNNNVFGGCFGGVFLDLDCRQTFEVLFCNTTEVCLIIIIIIIITVLLVIITFFMLYSCFFSPFLPHLTTPPPLFVVFSSRSKKKILP